MPALRRVIEHCRQRWVSARCAFCDGAAETGSLCRLCTRLMPWNHCFCECCGRPQPATQPTGVTCAACQRQPLPYHVARAPLVYAFPVDAALKAIKFRRQLWYVPAFAHLLSGVIEGEFSDADALVPVPLHRWRHMRRGFNQANELCVPLQRACGLPVVHRVRRTRATQPQTGLSAAARRKNVAGAFAVTGDIGCRRPVIIDDVMTTGATCSQLAHTLLDAGAERVYVLTVARAAAGGGP
jgi:ComF family protein